MHVHDFPYCESARGRGNRPRTQGPIPYARIPYAPDP